MTPVGSRVQIERHTGMRALTHHLIRFYRPDPKDRCRLRKAHYPIAATTRQE